MRKLTKSRYKLGLECPNKLYYTRRPEYVDNKNEDPFLKALCQGGFQVEELARLHFPGGILLEGKDYDYDYLAETTRQHMEVDDIVLYEPAFDFEDLFVRVDILLKKGNQIDLIEVKSKSFDPSDPHVFVGARGGIKSDWKPYLFDIAFQHYVVSQCHPECNVKAYIMMADKNKKASIDGLNQLFRIVNDAQSRTGIEKKVKSLEETGDSVLSKIEVTDIIKNIQNDVHQYYNDLSFAASISLFKEHYQKDEYFNWPTSYTACRKCEFYVEDPNDDERSGFHECFQKQHQWSESDFQKPNIMDVWNFQKGSSLFNMGKFFMEQLTREDVGVKPGEGRLTNSERHWIQIEKAVNGDDSCYVDREGLRATMATWKYPLHFIDFETSAVALPFHKGRGPYEQTAFQFSHHTVHQNGKVTHEQFLLTDAGVFPNYAFIRELKIQLEKDDGTIFRFATHENTILNAIYEQLKDSNEADRDALMAFIQTISHSKNKSEEKWVGERDMIDLCEVIKKYYYNPWTEGSNSMKKILPAILKSNEMLRTKYSQPIEQLGIESKNMEGDHKWITVTDGEIQDPYQSLPPLFDNWSEEELDGLVSDMEGIADGGAALTAYGKLQFTEMSPAEREAINNALLKYCELDTLAMVMVWEEFPDVLKQSGSRQP